MYFSVLCILSVVFFKLCVFASVFYMYVSYAKKVKSKLGYIIVRSKA